MVSEPRPPSEENRTLAPCPWCAGTDIRIYVGDGIEYAQCQDCTSCGPDHKNGRHWNDASERAAECARLLSYAITHSNGRHLFAESFIRDAKAALGLK